MPSVEKNGSKLQWFEAVCCFLKLMIATGYIYKKKIPGNIYKSPNSSSLSNVISGLKTTIDQQ